MKFNFKFDYSKFVYINAKEKSIIICPEHGEFLQNADKHLQAIHACKSCEQKYKNRKDKTGVSNKKKRVTEDAFLKRFYEKFDKKYKVILDNYTGISGNKIEVICPTHGRKLFYPNNIRLSKTPCTSCSAIMKVEKKTMPYADVINELRKIHNNKYNYPTYNSKTYKTKNSIIDIVCPKHGVFKKKTQKHRGGQGCIDCRIDKLILDGRLAGGYSDGYFRDNPEKKLEIGTLYYLKIGKIYKIGITTNLHNRVKAFKSKSKNSVDILFYKEYNLYKCYKIEQRVLSEFSHFRTFRKWSTELFDTDIRNEIAKYF
jgi:DNA-directed RNA polymerase subunit M/transcription elongation factor TFIIS